jgi:hypothetical protein
MNTGKITPPPITNDNNRQGFYHPADSITLMRYRLNRRQIHKAGEQLPVVDYPFSLRLPLHAILMS